MKINTRFTVAIHILAILALSEQQKTSEQMSKSIGNHPVAVRQVMSLLKKADLIETQNGVAGGTLKKPQEDITLYDIYKAVEGDEALFGTHCNPNKQCPVGKNILAALDEPLLHAQTALEKALKDYTLKDITSFIVEKYYHGSK